MVKIRKGSSTALVPYSTYKNHYEKLGWKVKGKKNKMAQTTDMLNTQTVEGNYDEDVELASMNVSQLKNFAAQNDIDISAANSKKEMREIIADALNN